MSEVADDLIELGTLDEATAWVPGDGDHTTGITPPWCELVLEVTRTDDGSLNPSWPLNIRAPLRRHDGELIIQVLHETLHPSSGGSVVDMLFMELDDIVDRIQRRVTRGKEPFKADVGMARGLALSIAITLNPRSYDVDAVREIAMERWSARNPEDND